GVEAIGVRSRRRQDRPDDQRDRSRGGPGGLPAYSGGRSARPDRRQDCLAARGYSTGRGLIRSISALRTASACLRAAAACLEVPVFEPNTTIPPMTAARAAIMATG